MRMIKQKDTHFWVNFAHSVLFYSTLCLFSVRELNANTLVKKNPFLPKDNEVKVVSVPVPPTPGVVSKLIEFRGFYTLGNVTQFSIYNKRENKGYWISQNQSKDGISVSNFNNLTNDITVSMNGRSERLTLMNATSTPLPVVSSYNQSADQTTLPSAQGNLGSKPVESTATRVVPRRRVILPKK